MPPKALVDKRRVESFEYFRKGRTGGAMSPP
jgi:hypothetical protein